MDVHDCSQSLLHFSSVPLRVFATSLWSQGLLQQYVIDLLLFIFIGLFMDPVVHTLLFSVASNVPWQIHVCVILPSGISADFAGNQNHAGAGHHLRLAAGAVGHVGEDGAISVIATWSRPFPVNSQVPSSPSLLDLSLNLPEGKTKSINKQLMQKMIMVGSQ